MPLLLETNPHPKDGLSRFKDPGHRYYYEPTGARIRKSMTGILKPFFDTFDGKAVATRCLSKWLRDDSQKYWGLCNYLKMVSGMSNEQIVAEIIKLWDANGNAAAAEGTKMHEDLEKFIQGMLPPPSKDQEAPTACAAYLGMLDWFYPDQQLEPWRCEFPIVLVSGEVVVACGTVDFIMRSKKTGKYWVLDWKHTNPKKKGLLGKRKAGAAKSFFPPDMAKGMFSEYESSDYNKYSAQLLGYKYMLVNGGYFKASEIAGCYIVQIHEDLEKANVVEVNDDDDFRATVTQMMDNEVAAARSEHEEAKRQADDASAQAVAAVEIGDESPPAAKDEGMFDTGDGKGPQPVKVWQTGPHSFETDANF
jgi:hypothetical protein